MNEEIKTGTQAGASPVASSPASTEAAPAPESKAPAQPSAKTTQKRAPKAAPRKATPAAPKEPAAAQTPPASETATKSAKKAETAKTPQPAEAAKPAKTKKQAPAKRKLIRDSFTLPEDDYALFAVLKQRALKGGVEVKKSELLRAGLGMLARSSEAEFLEAAGLVERIKTGRPKK